MKKKLMAIVLSGLVFVLPNASSVMASTSGPISVDQVKSFKDTQKFTDKAGNEFLTFTEPETGRRITINGVIKDREVFKETIKNNSESIEGKLKLSFYDQSDVGNGYDGSAHSYSYVHAQTWADLVKVYANLNGAQYGEWTAGGNPNTIKITENVSVSGLSVNLTYPLGTGFVKETNSSLNYESQVYTGINYASSSYNGFQATSYFGLFGVKQTDGVIANYNNHDYRAISIGDILFPI